ncbi:DinB family protein [Paenibacillus dokdonensis]|uniref:DinB family protein n=1 Tax=Paenibacillus dokdonensis TaxID=2567944 RepID=UPI001FEC8037|nr:DinB family protein [Paenibacillus dokdonensis]
MLKKYALQQFDYHVWANRQVCNHLQNLPDEVCRKKIASVFPTIYDTIVHIYVIDRGWLSFLTGGGISEMSEEYIDNLKNTIEIIVAETHGKSIEELGHMQDELAVRFQSFIGQHEDIEVVYPSGTFNARCVDYIQHMVNHGTYHRGNVTAMLRQLGYAGTPTDYAYYLYNLSH